MAGFDYQKSQRTAERLILKFGQPRVIQLARFIPASGPASNPTPQGHAAPIDVNAVVLPASKGTIEAFDNRLEGGTLIDEKLRYVIISPLDPHTGATIAPDPKSLDHLLFDGHKWVILGCTPLNPSGIPVYFPVGCKRA